MANRSGGSDDPWPVKAYKNDRFIFGKPGRSLRLLAEYSEPEARFEQYGIADTVVFFGSARVRPHDVCEAALLDAEKSGGDIVAARQALGMSRYYEAARELAFRLTNWSKSLEDSEKRFVVCTGGGPGIMEAANRGASEAAGINIGLNISLPREQHANPYITRELNFEFHYFFMRKFWFMYLAKALIAFPGGFGTLDEFFETLTLIQTRKLRKRMPVVLFGGEFWSEVINFPALVQHGTIAAEDLGLFKTIDSVDEAFDYLTCELTEHALCYPGRKL
ncbi:MAG: LOG family protein [Proteobacteria bacterium]|nr:LOG family protein [Pseudomonadota bacterium]